MPRNELFVTTDESFEYGIQELPQFWTLDYTQLVVEVVRTAGSLSNLVLQTSANGWDWATAGTVSGPSSDGRYIQVFDVACALARLQFTAATAPPGTTDISARVLGRL